MTSNIQISTKLNDGTILVVGGADYSDFANNIGELLDPAGSAAVLDLFNRLVPLAAGDPMGAAVAAVQPYAHPQQPAGYGAPAPAPAPLPASAPTAGGPPQCAHGDRKWVTSKPGAPKTWQAWMCGARQGDPTKCDPQWA